MRSETVWNREFSLLQTVLRMSKLKEHKLQFYTSYPLKLKEFMYISKLSH